MNKDWEIKKLGDVCEFRRGLTYSKNDEVENSSNAILRSNNIDLITNQLDLSEIKYISDKIKIDETKKVKRNSLLICTANGSKAHLGKVALIDDDYDFAFGGFMGLLIPRESIYPRFFYYALISENYKKFIKSLSDGANINNLKFQDLSKFEIPVPPLEEQKRIVKILDEKFAQLETIKVASQTNLQNAKDLFQSQLAKAFSNTTWEKKRLGDICSKIVDGTHNSPPNTKEGDYQYITAKNIKLSGIDLSDITYVTKEIHESIYSRCNPEKGDVLLIKDGATTGIAVVNELDYQFSMLSSVALLKFDRNILDSYCLAYLLNSDETYKRFRAKMEGAAITRLTLVKIKDFEIPLPPLPEQKRIVKELDTLSEKVRQLQEIYTKQIANCDELKQSYLQKAFEGEL